MIVVLFAASGCAPDRPSPTRPSGTTASAIQGGAIDMTDNFAVGVCGTDTTPGQCELICSGVLIAPNLVATARHCVDQVTTPSIDCSTTAFGSPIGAASAFWITTNYDLLQASVGWHQVSQIITPTPTAFCGNDLALLILTDNVPASDATPVVPEVQYPLTDPTRFSGEETAIGYGLTEPVMTPTGIRHIKEDIPIDCIPGDMESPCAPVAQSGIAENEFQAGDGPCNGDSGSGAYEQTSFNAGMPIALGVLSRNSGAEGDSCVGSTYTRLDTWRDLIVSTAFTAASLGHYAAPAWTAPAPPDDAGALDASPDVCADAGCEASSPVTASGGCSVTFPRNGPAEAPIEALAAGAILVTFLGLRSARSRSARSRAPAAHPSANARGRPRLR
jgi:hypothetical protein